MAQSLYEVGADVYLRASATKGFLEHYTVVGLGQGPDGFWRYSIGIAQSPPIISTTVGDRSTLKGNFLKMDIEFYEDDLITYCDALDIAIPIALAQYNRLIAMRDLSCIEEGSDVTGTD